MSETEKYLQDRFLNAEQFADACELSMAEVADLISWQMIPCPTYVVSEESIIGSHLFGEIEALGVTPGSYFHPANVAWVKVAREVLANNQGKRADQAMQRRFVANYHLALADLNKSCWRLNACFRDDGSPIQEGLEARSDSTWEHFLLGTWGMCVANPETEAAIAEKDVLQEKLVFLSEDGTRAEYSAAEAREIQEVIDRYEKASMPFSPAEYEVSSRKRLIDDLRLRLKISSV